MVRTQVLLQRKTNYPGEQGESPYHAEAGNYSFVSAAPRRVDGKVQTKLIDGEFYPKASESRNALPLTKFRGLLDLRSATGSASKSFSDSRLLRGRHGDGVALRRGKAS